MHIQSLLSYMVGKSLSLSTFYELTKKIKLVKRLSYGYRNFDFFKNRIFIIFRLYKRDKKKATPPETSDKVA